MITFLISLCVIAFMACMAIGWYMFLGLIFVALIIAAIVDKNKKKKGN